MEPRRRPVTSNDVARHAGVSQATVSLVLSGKAAGRVSASTEATVRQAAEELGYRPNLAARALRTGTARAVGLVVPDITHPFLGRVMRGTQMAARREGYAVVLVDAARDWTWEVDSFEVLRNSAVDGFLLFGVEPPQGAGELEESMVSIESDPGRLPTVRLDVEAGGKAVAEHLLGLGHRRLGRLVSSAGTPTFGRREGAWAAVLAAAGVDPDAVPRVHSAMNIDEAHDAGLELLAADPRPTAIFCDDDLLAAGLYLAVRELGLRIPDDVSVVGFDDLDIARVLDPALTTIAADPAELGAVALDRLLTRLAGRDGPAETVVPVRMVVRDSTRAMG
jgi:LacI family transcriptional regulator, repressor for deo operon, udp, cdd, tsx, nupC, and nupG